MRQEGRAIQAMDRLCGMAAALFKAGSAAVLLNQNDVSRIIASAGSVARFRTYPWTFSTAPYKADEEFIVNDASQRTDLQPSAHIFGLPHIGFYLRAPVTVAPGHVLSLIIAGKTPLARRTAHQTRLLKEIRSLIEAEFAIHSHLLTDPHADVTIAASLEDVRRDVAGNDEPAALLDRALRIIAINTPMASLLNVPEDQTHDLLSSDFSVPSGDAIAFLCRRALESKLSPPDFEIVTSGRPGSRRVFQLSVSPFSPIETREYFLHVTAREVTALSQRENQLEQRISRSDKPQPVEPTLAFLDETLVPRRSIRARNGVSYLTLRSWRRPIREYQIKALRALKQNIPVTMPSVIAREMAEEIAGLVGAAAFKAIVPVPCGHSKDGPCLSLEIARALSHKLALPVVQAFLTKPLKGSSHPKENAKRPPLTLSRAITEPVLLVDDVATSGAHVEEAVKLLKPHAGAVLALVWIGGDTA